MASPDVVQPSIETRLNLVSRRILILLGEQGDLALAGLGAALNVSEELALISVGWLSRSRVVDLTEDSSGHLQLRMRRSFE